MSRLRFVFCGLSITSSWGNGHATTYRALISELAARGHDVTFLERDVPWYAENRDLPKPPYCRTHLYKSVAELKRRYTKLVESADVVIVGSYVPEGVQVGKWVNECARGLTAFYDIDTPVTLAKLARGDYEYLSPELIPKYGLYLSFTGGPTLRKIERQLGSPCARVLYCSVDPAQYHRERRRRKWDLGYLGTYGEDRQPALNRLLLCPARKWPDGRFVVAGPLYPDSIEWPDNVRRVDHLPPSKHRAFYNQQAWTLNITRSDMVRAGYSPSVRLFEAAACGTPIISDYWEGLDAVFAIGREILVATDSNDALRILRDTPETKREEIGEAARQRVLLEHTSAHRARELEEYVLERNNDTKSKAPRVNLSSVAAR